MSTPSTRLRAAGIAVSLAAKGERGAGSVTSQAEEGGRHTETLTTSQVSRVWMYGAGALIVIGALTNSRPMFGLGLVLALALAVSYLWALYCLQTMTVGRRFSQPRAFWGEEVDMMQIYTNPKPLPIPWLAAEDQLPGTLPVLSQPTPVSDKTRTRKLSTALSVGWYERVTRRYRIHCTARGEHQFGPIEVRSGDIFGLFRRQATFETPQTLLVYPRYVPVERLGIPARQPFGDFKATQHLATDPLRIRGAREYAYGDTPRFIHWKATARRGEIQTKLFEPAATPQLYIFCNQDTFEKMYEGLDLATLELTITVAASLANYGLEQGYMVGLQVNSFASSSDRMVKLSPSRDPGQFTRVLENLARLKGWSGLPVEDLLRAERRNFPIGATLVIVTGVVTEEMLDILLALRRAGHPVTLVETAGSARAEHNAKRNSPDLLQAQGITYYFVNAVGHVNEIEELTF